MEHSPWARTEGGDPSDGSAATLVHEHRDVDEALEAFMTSPASDGEAARRVDKAIENLRRHIYAEEEFLFPPLAQDGLVMPIAIMLREHGSLWKLLDELEELMSEPERSREAVETVQELLDQLERHNLKEERVVYTAAESVLTAEQKSLLAASLERDAVPQGWVCREA